MSRWIQRVAPPPMHSAPHHRHRMARPGLALSVVIDEDGTRLLPCGVDATCRQHRRVRLRPDPLRSSSSRTGARVPRLARGHSLPLVCLGSRSPAGQGCQSPYRFSAYAIVTATGTPSPRLWARNAIAPLITALRQPIRADRRRSRTSASPPARGSMRPSANRRDQVEKDTEDNQELLASMGPSAIAGIRVLISRSGGTHLFQLQ